MARSAIQFNIEWRGMTECRAWLASINTALANANRQDIDMSDVQTTKRGVEFGGVCIVDMLGPKGFDPILMTLQPTASITLFVGWVLAHLPGSARVVYVDGWPHIHCPPCDDGEAGAAGPQVPGELVPA